MQVQYSTHYALYSCTTMQIQYSMHYALYSCTTMQIQYSMHYALYSCTTMQVQYSMHYALYSYTHTRICTALNPGTHCTHTLILACTRDNDAFTYFREWGEGLLVGGFEPHAKPIWTEGVPQNFAFNLLPDDPEHFMQIWDGAQHR
jgi:hypothetical protein